MNCTVHHTKLFTPLHTIYLINGVVKNRSGGRIPNIVLQANGRTHAPRPPSSSPINLTYTSHPFLDRALPYESPRHGCRIVFPSPPSMPAF